MHVLLTILCQSVRVIRPLCVCVQMKYYLAHLSTFIFVPFFHFAVVLLPSSPSPLPHSLPARESQFSRPAVSRGP